jgi:ABC-type sulfate/molybdate transport systems ATPase subunit
MVEIGGHRIENTAPLATDGAGEAFIRPHEFELAAVGQAGVAVTLRRITRTGPMAALDFITPAGALIEVTTLDPPAGLAPGTALTLVPRRVRAYATAQPNG